MNDETVKRLADIGVEITPEGMRYDLFLEHAWMMLVARLEDADVDPVRLMEMKTVYWSGASAMLEAMTSIDDYAVIACATSEPAHKTAREVSTFKQQLRDGLAAFGASLNPLRKLDS